MADRTSCTLSIFGRMTQEAYDAFSNICEEYTDEIDNNWFSFPEMAYGEMPDDVAKALEQIDVGYVWDISCDYAITPLWKFRLMDGLVASLPTSDGEVVLSLVQIEYEEVVKQAKAVTAMMVENDFKIIGDTSVTLSYREHATMLAALRYYQNDLRDDHDWLHGEIATDGGTLDPLTVEEIDALCERINS